MNKTFLRFSYCHKQELFNDMVVVYNEAKALKKLTTEHGMVSMPKKDLISGIDNILHWMSKYIDDNDKIEEL
jgi:hypothetical protein